MFWSGVHHVLRLSESYQNQQTTIKACERERTVASSYSLKKANTKSQHLLYERVSGMARSVNFLISANCHCLTDLTRTSCKLCFQQLWLSVRHPLGKKKLEYKFVFQGESAHTQVVLRKR